MPTRDEIGNFYTWGSFLSLTVSAAAVWIVAGAVSHAFQWSYPSYFPFLLAIAFAIIGDFAGRSQDHLAKRIILWGLNGCLIYTTAVGGTEVTNALAKRNQTADIKADAERIENATQRIAAAAGTPESEELTEASAQIRSFGNCVEQGGLTICGSSVVLEPLAARLEASEFPPEVRPEVVELKSDWIALDRKISRASGRIGFNRLTAVLEAGGALHPHR